MNIKTTQFLSITIGRRTQGFLRLQTIDTFPENSEFCTYYLFKILHCFTL